MENNKKQQYVNLYINALTNKIITGRNYYDDEKSALSNQRPPKNGYTHFGVCEVRAEKENE